MAQMAAPETPRDPLDDLPVDRSALEGNPFERRARFGSTLRTLSPRVWTAAALAAGVLMVGWHLRPQAPASSPQAAMPVSLDGIARIKAADPGALRQQLVDELRTVGVQANGYEQLGIAGVDADLPVPLPEDVRRVLERHRIPLPANGALRVQITAAAR